MEKSTRGFWTRQTLDWYLRASAYESYHRETAKALIPMLSDGGSVCDLGCGPGRLTLELLPSIPRMTAIDQDPLALDALRRDGAAFSGLHVQEADAMALPDDMIWDHLLLSFFGRLMEENHLQYFLSHCRKQLIAIVSAGPKSGFSATGLTARHKEYAPQLAAFLLEQGLSFQAISKTLDFGQPLADLEEAAEFIRHYSPSRCENLDAEALQKRLIPLEDGSWYLPNHKKIVIFKIDKGV